MRVCECDANSEAYASAIGCECDCNSATTRCLQRFVVCALGVCANERKNVREQKRRKKKRGYTAGGHVYCICFCFRARCGAFINPHVCMYVCMCVSKSVRLCMCVCVALSSTLPATFGTAALVDERETSFLCLYTRMSFLAVVVVAVAVVVADTAAGLLAILHLLFSISRLPPPHLRIRLYRHTNIHTHTY